MINNNIQAFYKLNKCQGDFSLGRLENLVPQYLKSNIEVFSHQVYASLLALSNPCIKGFILADEAGLGKTIEASLIASQYLMMKSKILVVVPQPTIDDWLINFIRRFNMSCTILDNRERPQGTEYKLSLDGYENGVVLTTYDYITANIDLFKQFEWNVCILDEAHRFRTYKIKENKTADLVLEVTPNAKKILLTATPIQKNEDDVFGLISFIDEEVFPDYDTFHKRYFRKPENYGELSGIIEPYIFRTLREEVRAETKLTERQILTQIYEMTEKEQELYTLLESYISKNEKVAFPEMEQYELSLMLFGMLSSSPYALSKTLAGIFTRLNKHATEESLDEAREIHKMLNLATSITSNNKDTMLLKAIEKTFAIFQKKGILKKCVIFTQNTQTQEHLQKFLSLNTQNEIYIFNGTTTNEPTRKFLLSKKPSILISTDKGNDSLNWQEAAFVVNYDFPQVLLDMEQRISRCHRIGQKTDVFVLNFICPNNFYDVRMYELFYKRINISSSIVGASDNIISGAEKGDIEKNITDMLENVRKSKQVQLDFADIHEEFKTELEQISVQANTTLFKTFNKGLVEKTKNMGYIIQQKAKELRELTNELARYFYKDSFVSENVFETTVRWHNKNPYAPPFKFTLDPDDKENRPFTLGSEPFDRMVTSLSSSFNLEPQKLVLKSDGVLPKMKGYISCTSVNLYSQFSRSEKTEYVGITENGEFLTSEECEKILELECKETEKMKISEEIQAKLKTELENRLPKILEPLYKQIEENKSTPIARIKFNAELEKSKLAREIKDIEREIGKLKNNLEADTYASQLARNQKINELSEKMFEMKDNEFLEKMKINRQTESKIQEFHSQHRTNTSQYPKFVVYFEVE